VDGPRQSTRWCIETDRPVWAAAPGQAAVLYDGDVVLGGGRIALPLGSRPVAIVETGEPVSSAV